MTFIYYKVNLIFPYFLSLLVMKGKGRYGKFLIKKINKIGIKESIITNITMSRSPRSQSPSRRGHALTPAGRQELSELASCRPHRPDGKFMSRAEAEAEGLQWCSPESLGYTPSKRHSRHEGREGMYDGGRSSKLHDAGYQAGLHGTAEPGQYHSSDWMVGYHEGQAARLRGEMMDRGHHDYDPGRGHHDYVRGAESYKLTHTVGSGGRQFYTSELAAQTAYARGFEEGYDRAHHSMGVGRGAYSGPG